MQRALVPARAGVTSRRRRASGRGRRVEGSGRKDKAGSRDEGTPARWRGAWLVAAALIALFALRSAGSVGQQSVTVDEFVHLPVGLAHLRYGTFAFDDVNPPLARMLQGLAALTDAPALPSLAELDGLGRSPWTLGYAFQGLNRERYLALFERARWASIGLGALLALAVFGWARSVWGERGALVSLALVAFEPNLLAHAGLVTSDVPFALACVLSLWSSSLVLERGRALDVAIAGLALGLALLTKFSALLLVPILLGSALVAGRPRGRSLARMTGVCALSLIVLNAGYLFDGTLQGLAAREIKSPALSEVISWTGRVPLPTDYLRGVDLKATQVAGRFPTYLNGTLYRQGAPWYYDLEAWLLKTPLAELAAVLLAIPLLARAARSRSGRVRLAAILWGVSAGALLVSASLLDLNLGVRYVLVLYPLGALAAGALFERAPPLALALLALHAFESVTAYPHELAFFNAAVGGPRAGIRFLADSNLDWGQDLPALASRLRELGCGPVRLAYFGRVDPRLYGIEYELPEVEALVPGCYAISANFLVGMPYFLYDPRSDSVRTTRRDQFVGFRRLVPAAMAGASIYLYHVD